MFGMTTEPAPRPDAFRQRLAQARPLLLDGGLATQLEAMGQPLHDTLWSAGLLLTAPEAIVKAHEAYLAAGAEVLITASYQASREGLQSLGLSEGAADEAIAASVALARRAAAQAGRPETLVAASVGPWGATRHDGSEYTGRYAIDDAGLTGFHRERLEVLDRAGADVLACETIPSQREARVLARLLRDTQTPAWVSFCCRDAARLSDGSPVNEAAARFADHPGVLAIGVNCTAPRHVPGLIESLRGAAPGLPILIYPNSGEDYDARQQAWRGQIDPLDAGPAAQRWIELGARGVGGCCRMGPAHIQAMATQIDTLPAGPDSDLRNSTHSQERHP